METTEQAWFLQVVLRELHLGSVSVGRARPEADVGSLARERGGWEGPLRSRSLLHVAELQIEDLVFGLLRTLRLPSPPLPQRMVDVVRHSHVLFRPVQLYSLL